MTHRDYYILLSEVIPKGKIISEDEGIIEYKGVEYILGTHDLIRKRDLIKSLKLLNLGDYVIVDMRFDKQIIIRTTKREVKIKKLESESKNL